MPRPYKALQKQGYKHYFTALTGRTRIADIAIIHFKASFVGYCGRGVISITRIYSAGEACLAPTKPCIRKALPYFLCILARHS